LKKGAQCAVDHSKEVLRQTKEWEHTYQRRLLGRGDALLILQGMGVGQGKGKIGVLTKGGLGVASPGTCSIGTEFEVRK
jgi:hypothetical protein